MASSSLKYDLLNDTLGSQEMEDLLNTLLIYNLHYYLISHMLIHHSFECSRLSHANYLVTGHLLACRQEDKRWMWCASAL